MGVINDDLTLVSLTFLILGIAGLEFSFGFLLILLFKLTNQSLILIKNPNNFQNNSVLNLNGLILNQVSY